MFGLDEFVVFVLYDCYWYGDCCEVLCGVIGLCVYYFVDGCDECIELVWCCGQLCIVFVMLCEIVVDQWVWYYFFCVVWIYVVCEEEYVGCVFWCVGGQYECDVCVVVLVDEVCMVDVQCVEYGQYV